MPKIELVLAGLSMLLFLNKKQSAMLLSLLISLMISFGFISTEADYHNLTPEQQTEYEIIIDEAQVG